MKMWISETINKAAGGTYQPWRHQKAYVEPSASTPAFFI